MLFLTQCVFPNKHLIASLRHQLQHVQMFSISCFTNGTRHFKHLHLKTVTCELVNTISEAELQIQSVGLNNARSGKFKKLLFSLEG